MATPIWGRRAVPGTTTVDPEPGVFQRSSSEALPLPGWAKPIMIGFHPGSSTCTVADMVWEVPSQSEPTSVPSTNAVTLALRTISMVYSPAWARLTSPVKRPE
ncbi:MAG: hypothetical protein JJLCMIEE_01065 [Acidimicrobiales bacterium]|nr:hypothetical protein [Acidimicrobiales bacterium]